MKKIKILLVDDNPFGTATVPFDDIQNEILNKNFALSQDEISEITEFDIGFPILKVNISGKNAGILDFIELKWLYSTGSIKNYIDTINSIEDLYGNLFLGLNGYVPDIIVFDYALTGNERHQPKGYRHEFIKKALDPCYNTYKYLINKNSLPSRPSEDYKWPEEQKNNDRFGLYAGGVIVERFRHDTPCFGIPATYWKSTNLEKTEAGFFEWLLNGAFRNVFDNPELKGKTERQKSWQIIIDTAWPEYRQSIIELVGLGKISVDLVNLLQLLSGQYLDDTQFSAFVFNTIYGLRNLSLDGLFIDIDTKVAADVPDQLKAILGINKATERDVHIWIFLNDILNALLHAADLSIGISEIENAIANCNNLMNAFDSVNFKKRILLSYYHDKLLNKGIEQLSSEEIAVYDECLKSYRLNDNKIDKSQEYSLSVIAKGGRNGKLMNRLTAFFVATRLWERYSSYISSLAEDNTPDYVPVDQLQIAKVPPKVSDFILALFPIWTEHVVLFNEKGLLLTKPIEAMGKTRLKTLCDFGHADIEDKNGIDLREQMTIGEFMIVKSFAVSLNFKKLPFWLKQNKDD